MKYIDHNGSIFTPLLPDATNYGEFYGVKEGNSFEIDADEPPSCMAFVAKPNGKISFVEPVVCEMCEHFIECHMTKGEEEKEFEKEPGVDLIDTANKFDAVRFKKENALVYHGTTDPANWNW